MSTIRYELCHEILSLKVNYVYYVIIINLIVLIPSNSNLDTLVNIGYLIRIVIVLT